MLELRNILKKYLAPSGEVTTVLRLESLTIQRGEQLVLVGPSGSGKTTLLHIISGLITPDAGEVLWDGQRLDTMTERVRDSWRANNVGYIFQNLNLLPSLTVLENILVATAFGGTKPNAEQRKAAIHSLSIVGLADQAHFKPHQLSTGEQQRVAVVRALINKPPLILADEPTASLDSENTKIVLSLLQQLCIHEQSTLVLATHDSEVMEQFPRQFALRRPGREAQ